jgi:beta-lactamase regulating signal transducer with metallopeptidase domain
VNPLAHLLESTLFAGAVWLGGCISILTRWYVRWRGAARQLRQSVPWSGRQLSVPVLSSEWVAEPGVFGIVRPVLVLPADIEEHLSAEQLRAVMSHELCHIRHRDNLAAAVHMLVEALFWFHPLVWWMGARLVEEREHACDEEVLELGSDPTVYAESILRVCRRCLQPPVPCVSGIAGAGLKERIRNIMSGRAGCRLEPGKRLLLAGLAIAAVVGPLAIGLTHPAKLRAQTVAPLRFEVASVNLETAVVSQSLG